MFLFFFLFGNWGKTTAATASSVELRRARSARCKARARVGPREEAARKPVAAELDHLVTGVAGDDQNGGGGRRAARARRIRARGRPGRGLSGAAHHQEDDGVIGEARRGRDGANRGRWRGDRSWRRKAWRRRFRESQHVILAEDGEEETAELVVCLDSSGEGRSGGAAIPASRGEERGRGALDVFTEKTLDFSVIQCRSFSS